MKNNENREFYVYKHIRKDNNTCFYVGKGKQKRCYTQSRGEHHDNICKRYGYYVVKVKENLTEKEAFALEREIIEDYVFVFGYGIDIKGYYKGYDEIGHLTNRTWGGEGTSGISKEKSELEKLKSTVTSGDTICYTEVSSIISSSKQLCEIIEFCKEKHIRLELGNFVVDCTKELYPMTEGMLKMMGVFAELERNNISEKIKSGMENAKAKGVKIGRVKTSIDNIPKDVIKYYELYKTKKINKSTYAKMCGCTRQSIYKYIKIIEEAN